MKSLRTILIVFSALLALGQEFVPGLFYNLTTNIDEWYFVRDGMVHLGYGIALVLLIFTLESKKASNILAVIISGLASMYLFIDAYDRLIRHINKISVMDVCVGLLYVLIVFTLWMKSRKY